MTEDNDNLDVKFLAGEGELITDVYSRNYDGGNYRIFGAYPSLSTNSDVLPNGGTWCGERLYQYNFTGTWGLDSTGKDANPKEKIRLCLDTQLNRIPEKAVSGTAFTNKVVIYPFRGYRASTGTARTYIEAVLCDPSDAVSADRCIFKTGDGNGYYFRPYYNNLNVKIDSFMIATPCKVTTNDNVKHDMICRLENEEGVYQLFVTSENGDENLYKYIDSNTQEYFTELVTSAVEGILSGNIGILITEANNWVSDSTNTIMYVSGKNPPIQAESVTSSSTSVTNFYGNTGVVLDASYGPVSTPVDSYQCDGDDPGSTTTIAGMPRRPSVISKDMHFGYVYANCLDSSYDVTVYTIMYKNKFIDANNKIPGKKYWPRNGVIIIPVDGELLSYRFDWDEAANGLGTHFEFAGLKALSPSGFDYLREGGEIVRYRTEVNMASSYSEYVSSIDDNDNTEWPTLNEDSSTNPVVYWSEDTVTVVRDNATRIFCFKNIESLSNDSRSGIIFLKSGDVFYYGKNGVKYNGFRPDSYTFLSKPIGGYLPGSNQGFGHAYMCNRDTTSGSTLLNGRIGYNSTIKNLADLTYISIREDSTHVKAGNQIGLKLNPTDGQTLYDMREGRYDVTATATTCSGVYEADGGTYFNVQYNHLEDTSDKFSIPVKQTDSETGNVGILTSIVFEYDTDVKGKKIDAMIPWSSIFTVPQGYTGFSFGASLRGTYVNMGQSLYDYVISNKIYNNLLDFGSGGEEWKPYESRETDNVENIPDVVHLEYSIQGMIDGYDFPLDIDTNSDVRLLWYLVLDKSNGDVPDGVELEVLDAKIVYSGDDGIEVEDTAVVDATENLKQVGGSYAKIQNNVEQTADTFGINEYFSLLERSSSRFRTAFRLITTDGEIHKSDTGYTVGLYCRMLSTNGKFKDFLIKSVQINPMCSATYGFVLDKYTVNKSDHMVFFNNVRELEKDQLGKIYLYNGNTNNGKNKTGSVYARQRYIDDGNNQRYNIVEKEASVNFDVFKYTDGGLERIPTTSPMVAGNTYYVRYRFDDAEIDTQKFKIKVKHEVGQFVKFMPDEFKFNYKNLGVFDRISFDDTNKKYKNCTSIDVQSDPEHKIIFADPYDPDRSSAYVVGDYVTYEGSLYKCITDTSNPPGEWDANNWDKVDDIGTKTSFKIYEIETMEGTGKYNIRFTGSDSSVDYGKFTVRSGSESELEQQIYGDGGFKDITLDGNGIKTKTVTVDGVANTQRYINLFIEDTSRENAFNEVPVRCEMFGSYSVNDDGIGEITINEKYYENRGVLDAVFSEFKEIDFNVRVEGERCQHGTFHLADKFLYLSAQATISPANGSQASDSDADRVEIKNTKMVFKGTLKRGDGQIFEDMRTIWDSDYTFAASENGATCQIKLVVGENDNEVGKLKRSISDYYLRLTGYISYTYEIIIDNKKRKTVSIDKSTTENPSDAREITYKNIRTLPPLVITLKKTTVGYKEPITFVNCTDDKSNTVYVNPVITMTDEANTPYEWEGDSDDPTHMTKEQEFELGEYTFTATAKLVPELANNNCEGVTQVDSLEAPKLYILERSEYQNSVTRVLDGYKMVYPRHREDVLFAPNEWITAENINRRFEFIMDDLEYLAAQTKIYLKPPSRYCGFYGDFMSVINGEYRRVFGYVPNGDVEIYKNYNEHTSIDDADTTIRRCNAICVDSEPNLYVHQDGTISIYNTSKYESYRDSIVPSLVNEYITYIDRMAYSNATNKMYFLSSTTHKLYIFNRYQEKLRGTNINSSYFGEIGGYGGPWVHSKFNTPNDFFISTTVQNGENVDEIWVCDAGNRVIKHFSIKGQWISTIDLTELGYDLLGVCCDVNNDVHVLTDKYVLSFDRDGNVKNGFVLNGGMAKPLMIRPQYKSGFLYVLYEHWIDKYNLEGKYVGRFAEDDEFTYTTMAATENYDIYIATNKNILHYNDSLRIRTIAAVENAEKNAWSLDEIRINRDENIQDVVINTSFQRMYDNIVMYALCIFGKVVKINSLDEDKRIADLDHETYQKIYDFIHKERIFVGINELVTVETINRSLNQMYDFLQLMLDTI